MSVEQRIASMELRKAELRCNYLERRLGRLQLVTETSLEDTDAATTEFEIQKCEVEKLRAVLIGTTDGGSDKKNTKRQVAG